MLSLFYFLLAILTSPFKSKSRLEAESAATNKTCPLSFPKIMSGRTGDAGRPRWEWRRCGQTCPPKIIPGRIDDAVQPISEWQQWCQISEPIAARAHLYVETGACAVDGNTPHRRKELAAGVVCTENSNPQIVVMKAAEDRI